MTPHDPAQLIERLTRVLQNEAHAGGLKPTQWEALRYLARANRFSRTPSALTAYLGTTKGTVSQTVMALERKGLITKVSAPSDRRQVDLALTAAGRSLLEEDPYEHLSQSWAQLDGQAQEQLSESLALLLQEMLRRRKGRPFGVCRSCKFFRANAEGNGRHRCALLNQALTEADSALICVEQEPAG